ncbi:MAG: hypothetical protein GC146_07640 [Limimaricola sp.]|uniref:hypothetical protein n=1 Tax=Limimaricola sp. TaxID=2211665 RepID=UPI001E0E228F|nr:hypothetical protein [Limimaricola sp.]MBI1417076.1 hypothetical protein [Limimaricola sp.]
MRPALVYRWIVFLLAAFYSLRMILFGGYDGFGGPFRYLTIWALLIAFFSASRMIALEQGRSTKRWDGFVGMTSVITAMVVMLYWRLYLADPGSVTDHGKQGAWWLNGYLHGAGPALQWIDAVFIHQSFTRLRASALWLLGVIVGYVVWIELLVAPLNDSPAGSVTSGMPYPFLNNLTFAGRANFYITNLIVAGVMLAVFATLAWAVRRLRRQAAR